MTLDKIRNTSNNIFFKIFLTLIIVSFAAWGLSDIFLGTGNNIAKIDSHNISINEFISTRDVIIAETNAKYNTKLTKEMIAKLNIDDYVLSQLINRHLLLVEAENLGINISTDLITNKIINDRSFYNNGAFDKLRFQAMLKSLSMSEENYINFTKDNLKIEMLIKTLPQLQLRPAFFENLYKKFAAQNIIYDLFTISDNQSMKIDVSEKELKEFFERNTENYRIPELRDVEYIAINADDYTTKVKIGEDEIRKEYDEYIKHLKDEKLVSFIQYNFDNEQDAKAAIEEFKQSKQKILKTNKADDVRNNIPISSLDQNLQQLLLGLKTGEPSNILELDGKWSIFKLVNIVERKIPSYSETREQIFKNLLQTRNQELFYNLIQQIDSDVSSGMKIEEISSKYKIDIIKLKDISGKDLPGTKNIPQIDNFVSVVFAHDVQVESPLSSSTQGDYFFITKTTNLKPSKIRSLEDVKNQISTHLIEKQRETRVTNCASKLFYKLTNNKSNAEINISQFSKSDDFKFCKIDIKQNQHIKRFDNDNKQQLPEKLKFEIFEYSNSPILQPFKLGDGSYIILVKKKMFEEPSLGSDQTKFVSQLLEQNKNSVMDQLMQYLYKKYKVVVHHHIFNEVKHKLDQ